ncbi:hypothetical protein FQZ97_820670 [compost metagenome]
MAHGVEHGGARTLHDEVRQRIECVEPELRHHFNEPFARHVVARGERVGVAFGFHGLARVRGEHGHQGFIGLALREQLEHGNEQPLHVHVGAVGAEAQAADVHHVAGGAEQRDRLAGKEAGRHHDEVVQVPGALPGVVGDEDIAFAHVAQRVFAEKVLDGFGHGVDVSRRAGDGLRQHATPGVEHAG